MATSVSPGVSMCADAHPLKQSLSKDAFGMVLNLAASFLPDALRAFHACIYLDGPSRWQTGAAASSGFVRVRPSSLRLGERPRTFTPALQMHWRRRCSSSSGRPPVVSIWTTSRHWTRRRPPMMVRYWSSVAMKRLSGLLRRAGPLSCGTFSFAPYLQHLKGPPRRLDLGSDPPPAGLCGVSELGQRRVGSYTTQNMARNFAKSRLLRGWLSRVLELTRLRFGRRRRG